MPHVQLSDRHPDLVELFLDRPTKGNALSDELLGDFLRAWDQAVAAQPAVVVLRSTGSVFCGGLDLDDALVDADAARRFSLIGGVLERLAEAPFVTVALVNGAAFGAGADLVAACDYRVGTERARFRFPGPRFGMVLGLRRLAAVVGGETARDLALRGSVLAAPGAMEVGLLSHLIDEETWDDFVARLVADVADLDPDTRRSVLAITRDVPRSDGSTLLVAATAPGFADRINQFARVARGRRTS